MKTFDLTQWEGAQIIRAIIPHSNRNIKNDMEWLWAVHKDKTGHVVCFSNETIFTSENIAKKRRRALEVYCNEKPI